MKNYASLFELMSTFPDERTCVEHLEKLSGLKASFARFVAVAGKSMPCPVAMATSAQIVAKTSQSARAQSLRKAGCRSASGLLPLG